MTWENIHLIEETRKERFWMELKHLFAYPLIRIFQIIVPSLSISIGVISKIEKSKQHMIPFRTCKLKKREDFELILV